MIDGIADQTVVLLFAKHPKPGAVMTRLCPPLSHDAAARIQTACIQHIWSHLACCDWCRPVLVGTQDDKLLDFAALLDPPVQTLPQGDGDLGVRLARASKMAFESGAREVVFIGADSPAQDWEALRRVPETLSRVDVAIGPCVDGGYYFLATRRHTPELFSSIDWSTSHVLEQTCERANQSGLTVCLAETGYDIDRIGDLLLALRDLDPDSALAVTIRDVLANSDMTHQKETQ